MLCNIVVLQNKGSVVAALLKSYSNSNPDLTLIWVLIGVPNAAPLNAVVPNVTILNAAIQKILHMMLHSACSESAGDVMRGHIQPSEVIANDFICGTNYSDNKAITLILSKITNLICHLWKIDGQEGCQNALFVIGFNFFVCSFFC